MYLNLFFLMTVSYGFVFLVKVLPREGCPSSIESIDAVNK